MMTKFQNSIAALVREDRAENSIMQTISIAVSAILIAAGLITAPGLINNARDNNAKQDLANVAYAEEAASSNYGGYVTVGTSADTTGSLKAKDATVKFTQSSYSKSGSGFGVALTKATTAATNTGTDTGYTAYAVSDSGNKFSITNGSMAINTSPTVPTWLTLSTN